MLALDVPTTFRVMDVQFDLTARKCVYFRKSDLGNYSITADYGYYMISDTIERSKGVKQSCQWSVWIRSRSSRDLPESFSLEALAHLQRIRSQQLFH